MTTAESTAIVLFNLGGPEDLAAVEPFLINLFSDREIIQLPGGPGLQPLLARLIAKLRGPSVRQNYGLIGGGSPQLRITRAQAAALEARLNHDGEAGRHRVFIAMRYSQPSADEALGAIAAAGIRRVVTLTQARAGGTDGSTSPTSSITPTIPGISTRCPRRSGMHGPAFLRSVDTRR
jgi:ferrochelatase